MKVLLTGSSGTVGSEMKQYLESMRAGVFCWDRKRVPVDQYRPMEDFVREIRPDVIFHFAIAARPTGKENEGWLVNYEWTSELAWIARVLNARFIYTSSAMVFSDHAQGPFTVDSVPDASEGYGCEKRMSESRVFHQNPNATIARLGWQIGDRAGSNTMYDAFETLMKNEGRIRASTKWFPACSFLADTVQCLFNTLNHPPGLYMIDSNERWNYFEIATALNEFHQSRWKIEPTEDFVFDQRLIDTRLNPPSLKTRLPALSGGRRRI